MFGSLTRAATQCDRSSIAKKPASKLEPSPYVCSSTETGACGSDRTRWGFAEWLTSDNRKCRFWMSLGKVFPAIGSIRLWRTAKAIYGLAQRADWIVFARTKKYLTPVQKA